MPAGLGAFFNTNGSVAAFLLAIFNLGIATWSTCRSWRLRMVPNCHSDGRRERRDIAPALPDSNGAGNPRQRKGALKMLI